MLSPELVIMFDVLMLPGAAPREGRPFDVGASRRYELPGARAELLLGVGDAASPVMR